MTQLCQDTPPATRAEARLAWARHALADPALTLVPASSDASFRSYWRTQDRQPSWIVMDSPPALEDPQPWLAIGAQLGAAGLHVPAVRAHDLRDGFLLIEDLGTRTYLPELNAATADALYADALSALLRMQCDVDAGSLPPYDRALLLRELELMPEWFLRRHLQVQPDCDGWDVLEAAFTAVLHAALEQPRCFVHRDYHSRNLLLIERPRASDGRTLASPGIIDFQGAVHGPLTYDLASLLRDCYIRWDDARVAGWAEAYRQRLLGTRYADAVRDRARFMRWFDLTGLQRHIKVLGIFCRLHYRDGKAGYLDDLPRVYGYVLQIAQRYPELHGLAALLERHVGARDLRVPQPA